MLHYWAHGETNEKTNKSLSAAYILVRWPAANCRFEPRGKHAQFMLGNQRVNMFEISCTVKFFSHRLNNIIKALYLNIFVSFEKEIERKRMWTIIIFQMIVGIKLSFREKTIIM